MSLNYDLSLWPFDLAMDVTKLVRIRKPTGCPKKKEEPGSRDIFRGKTASNKRFEENWLPLTGVFRPVYGLYRFVYSPYTSVLCIYPFNNVTLWYPVEPGSSFFGTPCTIIKYLFLFMLFWKILRRKWSFDWIFLLMRIVSRFLLLLIYFLDKYILVWFGGQFLQWK